MFQLRHPALPQPQPNPQTQRRTDFIPVHTSATTASAATAAEVVTQDNKRMEGSSKPENTPACRGMMSAASGPLCLDRLEKLHSQADSFLTAARLLRGGYLEEGKQTRCQFSHSDGSARQPTPFSSQGNLNRAQTYLKDSTVRQVPVINSKNTTEDRESSSETNTHEAKQIYEDAFSAKRQAQRQTGCSQTGVVYIWASGCRSKCRQSRRFKAPILPVIAEI